MAGEISQNYFTGVHGSEKIFRRILGWSNGSAFGPALLEAKLSDMG
jgi:hypothetical protein